MLAGTERRAGERVNGLLGAEEQSRRAKRARGPTITYMIFRSADVSSEFLMCAVVLTGSETTSSDC
eukprot:499238-Hanusia_phi.AAC.2